MSTYSFRYRASFSYYIFFPVFLFSGIAIYCFVYQLGLRYRSLRFLDAPNSYYVTGGLAILFLLYAIYKYMQVRTINTNPNPILVSDKTVSFPKGRVEVAQVTFSDVNELWVKDDDDDGESLIIYVNEDKDRYEFFADYFESYDRFTDFKSIMEKRCVNITNRE